MNLAVAVAAFGLFGATSALAAKDKADKADKAEKTDVNPACGATKISKPKENPMKTNQNAHE